MNVEFISVASFILMSIVTFCVIKICLVMLSMQSRSLPLAVSIPVLPRMDDQRAFMVTTRRVGNRPVPQENDEWLCWESKRAQFIWFSLSNSTDMPYPFFLINFQSFAKYVRGTHLKRSTIIKIFGSNAIIVHERSTIKITGSNETIFKKSQIPKKF